MVTDYLNTEQQDCTNASAVNGDLVGLNIDGRTNQSADYTKDNNVSMSVSENCAEGGDPPSLGINKIQQNPLVPIISVTPHSPGLAKHYPVLEDNLQQLQEIHNSIQRMRDSTHCTVGYRLLSQADNLHRLSSSCPSLCPLTLGSMARGATGDRAPGSDPDLANCSTNSSPTHFPQGQLPPGMLGVDRRRSWTDLEESRQNRHRCAVHNHLQAQHMVNKVNITFTNVTSLGYLFFFLSLSFINRFSLQTIRASIEKLVEARKMLSVQAKNCTAYTMVQY